MIPHPDGFAALTDAIADGTAIDWEAVRSGTLSEDEQRVVAQLEELSKIGTTANALALTWGSLELRSEIGRGTYGTVYRAWDPRLERELALKLLHERTSPDAAARVLKEGRVLARIRHPNVVTIYSVETHSDRIGLSMEFVVGRTMKAIVEEQGPFGGHEAVLIGRDLCRALAAVHKAGFLHGDVKAQNVMREAGGRTVLMDFGAGGQLANGGEGKSVVGTPVYAAPEVLAGQGATERSDLYSLGVLLYYLVCGDFPVTGRTIGDLREQHARNEHQPLVDARPDLPSSIVTVIEQALAVNPAERPASAGAMERMLEAGSAPSPPSSSLLRRTTMTALLLVAILAATLAGIARWQAEASRKQALAYRGSVSEADLERLRQHPGGSGDALNLYLKGRYYWSQRTEESIQRSIQLFQEALQHDPRSALAYSGLADAYTALGAYGSLPRSEAFGRAAAAAETAVSLDATLAEAHASLAYARKNRFEWAAAERSFKRALELNPGSASTHHWYSIYLTQRGRFPEAITEVKAAIALDPRSIGANLQFGTVLMMARRYEDAIAQWRQALEIDPGFLNAYRGIASCYTYLGLYDKAYAAVADANHHVRVGTEDQELKADIAYLEGVSGRRDEALRAAQALANRYQQAHEQVAGSIAAIYAGLGQKDEAFEWLARARDAHDPEVGYLKVDPKWDVLRADRRFGALLTTLGLAD